MSADIKLFPFEYQNYNVLWDGVLYDPDRDDFIKLSEVYGGLNLPQVFQMYPRINDMPFWSIREHKDGPYIQGRFG